MLQPSSVDPTEIISIDGISSGSNDAVPQGKKVIEVVAGGRSVWIIVSPILTAGRITRGTAAILINT